MSAIWVAFEVGCLFQKSLCRCIAAACMDFVGVLVSNGFEVKLSVRVGLVGEEGA